MMPSGHKAFLVQNPRDCELLLMHNKTYAAEYVPAIVTISLDLTDGADTFRIGHAVSSRKRIAIIAKAKSLVSGESPRSEIAG